MNLEHYDARHAANPIKQWLGYLRWYYPQAAALFASIKRLRDPQDVRQAVEAAGSSAVLAA